MTTHGRGVGRVLAAVLAATVLSVTAAPAAEEANAPTVTGETGLFTLLSGDAIPGGNWSFGLYYNNWDRILGEDEQPGTEQRPQDDPAFAALTALLYGRPPARNFGDFVALPRDDPRTADPDDVLSFGYVPFPPSPGTVEMAFEAFQPQNIRGVPPPWKPDDGPPPLLDAPWSFNVALPVGRRDPFPYTYDPGFFVGYAGGIDTNLGLLGTSRFDLDGNGRFDDPALGQVLLEGKAATVTVPDVMRRRAVAGAAQSPGLPNCAQRLGTVHVLRGMYVFDRHDGSAASRNFRRHRGGTITTNAMLWNAPTFGRGGRVRFVFAGCGRGQVEMFTTFAALGLPPVLHRVPEAVADALVKVKLDGRAFRPRVDIETARERSVRPSPLWPDPPRGSAGDQVGLLITVSGRFDRRRVNGVARPRVLDLAPNAAAVRFVSRCTRRGGRLRRVRRGVACA